MVSEVIDSNVGNVSIEPVATIGALVSEVEIMFDRFGWLSARVEIDDDATVLIVESVTGQYGVGETFDEAVANLASELSEYAAYLAKRGTDGLSPRLVRHLAHLSRRDVPEPGKIAPSAGDYRQLSVAA